MSPHGTAGPPDQSSPNLGNKCELGRPQCCQISLHCDKKCARYLPSKLFDPIQGKSEPKFTKTVQDLLQTNVHHHAKFHCSPSDDVRKKCYNFFTHLLILAPQRTPWATVHQSWNWCIARPDLSMCQISSCSDNLCMRYLLPNFIDFVHNMTSLPIPCDNKNTVSTCN